MTTGVSCQPVIGRSSFSVPNKLVSGLVFASSNKAALGDEGEEDEPFQFILFHRLYSAALSLRCLSWGDFENRIV